MCEVHIGTSGIYARPIEALTKEEAIKIATEQWKEADFNDLEDADMVSISAYQLHAGEYYVVIHMEGYYSCILEKEENESDCSILERATNKWQNEADFGVMGDIEIERTILVTQWKI